MGLSLNILNYHFCYLKIYLLLLARLTTPRGVASVSFFHARKLDLGKVVVSLLLAPQKWYSSLI